MMDSPTGEDQLLPGLADPALPTGEVEQAARRTIRALSDEDLLAERDAVLTQALITLARQYDRAAGSARAKEYAVANLHAQLLSTIDQLPKREEADDDDPWTQLENAIHEQQRNAAARHGA